MTAAMAPDNSSSTPPGLRSCATCRQRRVRCDKIVPCSNCQRAGISCIVHPPPRVTSRPGDANAQRAVSVRSTKHRESELVGRLETLEATVHILSSRLGSRSIVKEESSPGIPHQSAKPARAGAGDTAKKKDSKVSAIPTRSFDGTADGDSRISGASSLFSEVGTTSSDAFWKKLNDEVEAMERRLGSKGDDAIEWASLAVSQGPLRMVEDHQVPPPMSHRAFMSGYNADGADLGTYHPLPSHAQLLWSVYQEKVEPLIKMVHVPTMASMIQAAGQDPTSLAPHDEALVFAVYYSALIAMEDDQVESQLRGERDPLLRRYRFALEVSLARADFLSTSELAVLQALTLFLIVVRRVDDSLVCWTLTGLVVRIARKMSVHRDGSHSGMTPYETEIRRRVWWAILVLDQRSAEEAGSDLLITEDTFNTRMPSNVNDADFGPRTTKMPMPSEGRSDMAAALARYEILALSRRLPTERSIKDAGLRLAACEKLLVDAYERVENRFLKQSARTGHAGSLWWTISLVVRIIVAKICLGLYESKVYPRIHVPSCPGSYHEDTGTCTIRDRVFIIAIETVELGNLLYTDDRCKNYRWLFMTYTNWHAIAISLIEISRRPWSALVERSWETAEAFDKHPAGLLKGVENSAMHLPLRKLRDRARRHRTAELLRLRMDPDASRRLDIAERSNPPSARFGPIPGNEGRMEMMRLKWWHLVQRDELSTNTEASARSTQPSGRIHSQEPLNEVATQPNVSVDHGATNPSDCSKQGATIVSHVKNSTISTAATRVEGVRSLPSQATAWPWDEQEIQQSPAFDHFGGSEVTPTAGEIDFDQTEWWLPVSPLGTETAGNLLPPPTTEHLE